jgi:2-hydroxy-4-carboxymuconate semialdehyde hemiacetal dehydrogenase
MRIAIIGYGAVAGIHARQLAREPGVEIAVVCGPDAAKARAFAGSHGIKRVVSAIGDLGGAADAAIVCSPSSRHFEQTRELLHASISTLVELPACSTVEEAIELGGIAKRAGIVLQCAHTSRYIEPFKRLGDLLARGTLGPILHVHFVRTLALRQRSWIDDALLHHAGHPLHLLLHWFAPLRLCGCAARPAAVGAQDVAILAGLENGAPATISISYTSRVPAATALFIGERHTFSTDGFSFIRSDLEALNWDGNAEAAYHASIHDQDVEFVRACRGEPTGTPWQETIDLTRAIAELRGLCLRD